MTVGKTGVIYFADIGNERVRALTPSGSAVGSSPAIKSGGIDSASAFGAFPAIAPGSWIEIYGSNLAADSRPWAASDFSGVNAPTSLDGTKVTIGGQSAFIDYISPGQVNAQVPSNAPTGSQPVIVTTASGASSPYTITVNATEPGLLAPSSFNIGGTQYAAALFSDGATYVLPPGAIAGVTSRRAQPGDTITLYGVGFGSVAPSISAGQIVQQSNTLTAPFQVKFGSTVASVTYDGLAPNAVGLYQFNVVVPSIPSSDAVPLTFTLNGVAGTQTLYLAVQNGSSAATVVKSLTLSASSVAGGGTVTGTVTLSSAAPAGGAVVALSSSSTAVSVPATVTVAAGATSATFTVTAGSVSAATSAAITASYGGGSASATLSVTASSGGTLPQFSSITIHPTLSPGSQVGLYITQILIFSFGAPGYSIGTIQGAILGASLPLPPLEGLQFSAGFDNIAVNGQTFTFSGLDVSGSVMEGPQGNVADITSGSLTVTLSPQVVPTSGTVSGSFTLVSTIATLSGSFSGTYIAQ